jgi:hypothetical protein
MAEANRILSEVVTWVKEREPTKNVSTVIRQVQGTDESLRFAAAFRFTEAHTIAFAQSLHSTTDMLAQVLCISLDLNRLFKPKENRYLNIVVNRMSQHGVAPSVVTAATSFLKSNEFLYLRAYVNTTKHISLVPAGYSYRLAPGKDQLWVQIAAFKYRNENWPEKLVADFIGADFERLSAMFDAIGIQLTAVVSNIIALNPARL